MSKGEIEVESATSIVDDGEVRRLQDLQYPLLADAISFR